MTTRYTRGVWSLENVENKFPDDDWVEITNVFTRTATEHAYFAGGMDNSYNFKSDYDKLTYATDTTENVPSSNFGTPGSRYISATNSTTAGYHNHGLNPGNQPLTNVSKYTFASDSSSQLPSSGFIRQVSGDKPYALFSVGTNTNGYFISGQPGPRTSCHKLVYSTDQCDTLPSGDASLARSRGMSVGTQTVGLLAGGYRYELPGPNQITSTIDKLTYSNETTAASPSTFPASRYSSAPYNNSTAGYFTGGRVGSSETKVSSTTKIIFSSDAISNVPGLNSTIVRYKLNGIGGTKGFIGGGLKSDGSTNVSTVDKINLTTETAALSPSGQLTDERRAAGCFGPQGNAMPGSLFDAKRWFDGANPTGNKMYCLGPGTTHDTFNMTTETAASLSLSGLPSLNNGCSAQNTTHSYIHAGPGKQTKVRKITWSTDAAETLPGTSSRNAEHKSGTGNETKGYFTQGGSSPGPCYSGSDRVTYASDTIERVPGADMVGGRPGKFGSAATGNQDTGYFMGGGGEWPGFPNYSDTNKLTYATDTNANCPAQMPTGMTIYSGSSASSSTAAYVSNYRNPSFHSKIFKLVFATDTVDTVGNTTVGRNGPAMGGNSTTMYMGGGSSPGTKSDFDKLVYATDTISNLPDANLQSSRYYTTGSAQRGERVPFVAPPEATPTPSTFPSVNPALNVNAVFAAGASPSSSTNQRSKFTFSNETMASMPSFVVSRNTFGGASSTTRGYLSGGFGNTSMGDTQNNRLYNQYSNDASGLVPGGSTSQNAGGMFSMNDSTKLYSGGGGWSGGQYNTVESMPFATEESTSEPGMTLTSPKKFASGIGNKTIGFVCGGNEGNNNRTTIDKVVYSTGTMSTSPSNLTLSGASPYHATMAVGDTTTGFIFQNAPTNKLVFATETVSSAPNNNTSNSWGNGTSSTTTGYVMNHPSGQYLIKYVFATETTGTLPSMFSPNRGRGGAMSTAMFGGAFGSTPNLI